MAVVTAGLVMGSYGRTKVSPATWHALHETWEQLGFWANSLIFFLVGILVPDVLKDFTGEQAIWLIVLIATAFVARAVVLYVLLPVMIHYGLGQKVSGAFRTIMFWGGLRGAVSLALALVVMETAGVDEEIKRFTVVLVTCFVLFTLFINATTIRFLMAMFGLDKLSAADLAIRDRVMALSLAGVRDEIHDVAKGQQIDPAIAAEFAADYDTRLRAVEGTASGADALSEDDRLKIGLGTLVNRERQIFLKRFADGFISDRITRALLANIDTLEDGLKSDGLDGYASGVREKLGFDLSFRIAMELQRRVGYSQMLAERLAERFDTLIATQSALRELSAYARDKLPSVLGEGAAARISDEMADRIRLTDQALDALKLQYPDYYETVQRAYLGRAAVRLEDQDYRRMLSEQMISQEVYNNLTADLDARQQALENLPQLDLGLEPEKLVAKVPFFTDLDQARIAEIAALLKPRLALPGETICRKGDPGDAMYFVSTGAVEVNVGAEPIRLGSGDFFGEIALVREMPRVADVSALTYCQILVLYARDFQPLMSANPDLAETIRKVAEERLGENA